MKIINLVTFNEAYWSESLIYSQHIKPLLQLKKNENVQVVMISFTSIYMLLFKRTKIKEFADRLSELGIKLINFPVLFYPSHHFIIHWYLYFYFLLNVFPYILFLRLRDCLTSNDHIYNLRSYMPALAFLKLYGDKSKLIFDPRTDWIKENMNMGNFSENSLTYYLWNKWEGQILRKFSKVVFISEILKMELLARHFLPDNTKVYFVLYNLVDYSMYDNVVDNKMKTDFLYTGSLGHWNNLSIYLDFFLSIYRKFPNSRLRIITGTSEHKVLPYISEPKYDEIRHLIDLYFDIPVEQLPEKYKGCAYGLQLMNKKDSRVGVKFVEYIAAGILPIVNENVHGAAYLCKKYNVGIVLSNLLEIDTALIKKTPLCSRNDIRYIDFRKMTDINCINEILRKIYMQ